MHDHLQEVRTVLEGRKWLWMSDRHESLSECVCMCVGWCISSTPAGVSSRPRGSVSVTVQTGATSGPPLGRSPCHRLEWGSPLFMTEKLGSVAAIFAGLGSWWTQYVFIIIMCKGITHHWHIQQLTYISAIFSNMYLGHRWPGILVTMLWEEEVVTWEVVGSTLRFFFWFCL